MRKLTSISLIWAILVSAAWVPEFWRQSEEWPLKSEPWREKVGPWLALIFPILVSLAALLALRWRQIVWRRVGCFLRFVLLLAFNIVAGFTIGLFYLPSTFAMMAACAWPSREGHKTE